MMSTRILGRRTVPLSPFLIPNRAPRGFAQDPSTDAHPNSALTGAESPALSSAPTLRPCDEREVGSVRVGPAWPSPREERESEDHKPESA